MRARLGALVLGLLFIFARRGAAEEPGESAGLLAQAERLERAGKYADGIPLAERALALREGALGAEHPQVAAALNRLGLLLGARGDLKRAEALLRRALAIRERALGPDHLDTLESVHDLGRLLTYAADSRQAELLLERALAGRTRALGPDHPAVAEVLGSLGRSAGKHRIAGVRRAISIYERALGPDAFPLVTLLSLLGNSLAGSGGDFAEAEQLQLRALQIGEAASPEHPAMQMPLNNLATIYMSQGDYGRALPLYQRAHKVSEASRGPSHGYTIRALGNIGDLHRFQGEYLLAEPYERRALEASERALGPTHPGTAVPLHDLADVLRHWGHYAEAERLLLRALAISANNSRFLTMLARVYHEQGALEKAEPLYLRALPLFEQNDYRIAELSPHLGYAALLGKAGRTDEAAAVLHRYLSIGEGRLRKERRTLSDAQLDFFLRKLRREEELTYSLLRRHPESAALRRLALSFALLRKGRSLEELAGTSRAVARDLSPADQTLFADLRARYGRLAALSLSGPGKLPAERYAQTIKELTTEADRLEQELATRSFRIRAQRRIPSPEEVIGQVAGRLPKDGALVEFVAYADVDDRIQRGPLHYLALVLHPSGRVGAVDLGAAASLDQAALRLRAALQDPRSAYVPLAQDLERRLLHLLRAQLGAVRKVLLSPDGALNQVPFAVLADGALSLSYLTSGRDLLREEKQEPRTMVAVLADPDFARAAAGPAGFGSAQRDRGLSTGGLLPLPGTRVEAEAIQRLLPGARLLLGNEASEGALLSLRAPGILHIATHGLFIDDAPPTSTTGRGFQQREAAPVHPLLRSALALAGAKQPSQGEGPDGLATALELSTMDLWGTQLVVLSACETGRGQERLGQGVYGLRRALAIAGAESLVTSLWKVDDQSTAELMTDFYRALLLGRPRGAALSDAMTAMRKKKSHPYYWAPFILFGNPAPLRGLGPKAQP